MKFVDGVGRVLEVITLDRLDGRGPRRCIRASWRGILLGAGYFELLEDALAHVDVASLVEVLELTVS